MSEFQQQPLCTLDTYEIKGKAGDMEKGKNKTKQKPKLHIRLHFKEQTQSQRKAGDLSVLASGTVKPRTITDPGKTKGRGRMKGKEKKKMASGRSWAL